MAGYILTHAIKVYSPLICKNNRKMEEILVLSSLKLSIQDH